jgi:HTH-type transcriptional regulator/antitoxin HipB
VRVRRLADLSQRELAGRLSLDASSVSRIESGTRPVTVGAFAQILAVAGLRLVVVDSSGAEVSPFPSGVVRDNAGRRFPAHLDVGPPDEVPRERWESPRYDRPEAQAWYHLRGERDRQRARRESPPDGDHPTVADLDERRRLMRGRQPRVTPQPAVLDECTCLDECVIAPECLDECRCQCESRA